MSENPRIEYNGHRIEWTTGNLVTRGVWTRPDGTSEAVEGSWVFAPGYSWFSVATRNWIVIGGAWQVGREPKTRGGFARYLAGKEA